MPCHRLEDRILARHLPVTERLCRLLHHACIMSPLILSGYPYKPLRFISDMSSPQRQPQRHAYDECGDHVKHDRAVQTGHSV